MPFFVIHFITLNIDFKSAETAATEQPPAFALNVCHRGFNSASTACCVFSIWPLRHLVQICISSDDMLAINLRSGFDEMCFETKNALSSPAIGANCLPPSSDISSRALDICCPVKPDNFSPIRINKNRSVFFKLPSACRPVTNHFGDHGFQRVGIERPMIRWLSRQVVTGNRKVCLGHNLHSLMQLPVWQPVAPDKFLTRPFCCDDPFNSKSPCHWLLIDCSTIRICIERSPPASSIRFLATAPAPSRFACTV